jgi:GxxExxY protein
LGRAKIPSFVKMTQARDDNSHVDNRLTYEIIGACMKVHRTLGCGLLESVYKEAIEIELTLRGILYQREKEYRIVYEAITLTKKFYADFVVLGKVILEVKAIEGGMSPAHKSQIINYLKISGCRIGLLINFGRTRLEYQRFVF